MTEFTMLHRRHKFTIRAIDKTLVVRIKRCPVCGEKLVTKREPFTLVAKG